MKFSRVLAVGLILALAGSGASLAEASTEGSGSGRGPGDSALASPAADAGAGAATAEPGDVAEAAPGPMTIENTLSDRAQATTIAFDALAFLTGSLCADSFYPPGKVADFFGFQYLRDNDATGFGHNTAFAGRVGENVLFILDDEQVGLLAELAVAQVEDINAYAYARFPLMAAFRRLLAGDLPAGSSGLSTAAVTDYSADVYRIDGEMSFARARAYAEVLGSLSSTQQGQLAALAATGVANWPDRSRDPRVEAWRRQLDHDAHVALMTFAGDLFSWYAGDLAADTYFCPERQGTYFGSFYMKDIPAMLSQQAGTDVSIEENLTGEYGDRLLDTLTASQRATIEGLVSTQRALLLELVDTREAIAARLRTLRSGADPAAVEQDVLTLSDQYGRLDGQIVTLYVTAFSEVYNSLTPAQLATLRQYREGADYLNLSASFGDPCSLQPEDLAYLYSQAVAMPDPGDTDFLFAAAGTGTDTTPPVVEDHADVTAEATGPQGAVVAYVPPAAGDLVAPLSPAVSCEPASGSVFPLGSTTVTCSATDAAGNTGISSFSVTVVDTTAPVLADVPDDVSVLGDDQHGSVITFAIPSATDVVGPASPAVSCTPASGSLFPVGETTVSCSAADAAGNVGEASFTVTVRAPVCGGMTATIWDAAGSGPLLGTAGADVIAGMGGDDTIYGLGGDDIICGGTGNDRIFGGFGRDLLFGSWGEDGLDGGPGEDGLWGQTGADLLVSGTGADAVDGGPGADTVSYVRAVAAVIVDLAARLVTGGDADTLQAVENADGSPFADTIRGSGLANLLRGLGGDDTLAGRGGDDRIEGGIGMDTADGGAGSDTCVAEASLYCEL